MRGEQTCATAPTDLNVGQNVKTSSSGDQEPSSGGTSGEPVPPRGCPPPACVASRLSPDCLQTLSTLFRQHLPAPFCTDRRICPPGMLSRSQRVHGQSYVFLTFENSNSNTPQGRLMFFSSQEFSVDTQSCDHFPQMSSNESIFDIILLDLAFSSLKLPHFARPSLSALRPFLGTLDGAFGCSRD